MLTFRILGPLEVESEGEPLPVGAQRQKSLLALFLLRANTVVSTDTLIDGLWGEQPPKTVVTSLQNAISQLRKLLGADVIVTRAPGYVLRIDKEDAFDLTRFERLIRRGREAPPDERARILRDALSLWRGDPLAEFAFEPFADREIPRLEELRLSVREERIDADLELERHAELVGELESLVHEHPLREQLRSQLMLALYRSGRQAEALNVFHETRRVLDKELGLAPSPSLQQLHASILRQEPSLSVHGAPSGEDYVGDVARELVAGRLVAVIGDDVSELAQQLSQQFGIPLPSPTLPFVSQYVSTMRGAGPLYDALHDLFADSLRPSRVHQFFASLPSVLRERGAPYQLLLTTSYDLSLEQAFADAGEEVDVVSYVAEGRDRGKFLHVTPEGEMRVIDEPNTYTHLSLERRTVILRLHGQVDPRPERERESFVITEDDYIAYLGNAELTSVVPMSLVAKLRRSHFVFLGYVLRDWNLRVVLHRLWGESRRSYRSWAVQEHPQPLEEAFWRQRDVVVVDRSPEQYVEALEGAVDALRAVEVDA